MKSDNKYAERLILHKEVPVKLTISSPVFDDRNENYECLVSITGGGIDRMVNIHGIDSMQCIILAIRFLSSYLYGLVSYKDGDLNWSSGIEGGDLGFPTRLFMGGYEETYK